MTSRRIFLIAAAALLSASHPLFAQDTKPPLRIIVGFPPGGGVDLVARNLAAALQTSLGQTVIVENKAGAGGQLAAQAVKAAAPDGNTLFLSNSHALVMVPLIVKNPGFDPAKDFVPISTVAIAPDVLAVHPSTNVTRLADFAAWAGKHPDNGNVGVPAPGSSPEFAVGVIGRAQRVELRAIPYRGGAPVTQDLLGGQVKAGISSIGEFLPHHTTGKLRILAVSGSTRAPRLPDVPTYEELGVKGLAHVNFLGMFAPAGTPPAVVQRYNKLLAAALAIPELREKLDSVGLSPAYAGADDLAKRVNLMSASWSEKVKLAGFQPQ